MMSDISIHTLRARILDACPNLQNDHHAQHAWWLLGTTGCHLCDDAEKTLAQLSAVHPIDYHYIDIADFDEDLMMQFATHIPVLVTQDTRLDYPFAIMDLQQLVI